MESKTMRNQVRGVAKDWRCHYDDGGSADHKKIAALLDKLDVERATQEDVTNIIGNIGWCLEKKCDECHKVCWDIVEVGCSNLCESCLSKALELLNANKTQETTNG